MEIWVSIGAVVLVFVMGVVTPGPNFLITMKNAIRYSRRIGVLTALGIALATLLHISAGFLGLTTILWRSPALLFIAKIVGGAYLVYLGVRALLAAPKGLRFIVPERETAYSDRSAFRSGFLTCLSNPKSTLFYLSLFTAVIPPTTPQWAQIVMVLLMLSSSVMWYSTVALLFSKAAVQQRYLRFERMVNTAVGIIFIALGVQIYTIG